MCYSYQTQVLANTIPSTQSQAIAETIYDALFPRVIACVVNQLKSYWLLFDVLILTIGLYVQLFKDRLKLQVMVDVAQEVDMCIRVKQLQANM